MALLAGKVVVVTGSSTGIGRAVAIACARNKANVILHHLNASTQKDIDAVQEEVEKYGGKAIQVSGDIADPKTASEIVAAGVKAFSRIDVLVSNAGICPFHAFLDLPVDLWKRAQAVNLDGAFHITQAVANQMVKQSEPKGGSIVAISSISALVGGEFQSHYTPTKAGVKSLMESCAIALGPLGIRCNSILPGTIETNINKEDLSGPQGSLKRVEMVKRIPVGRLGLPEDIADPVVFMASDMARYINGASLLVDGGIHLGYSLRLTRRAG